MIFGRRTKTDPDPGAAGGSWLIVGLGNPGDRFAGTRHNLGFMVVDELAADAQTSVKRSECGSVIGQTRIGDQKVEFAKPQTFMNLSGDAVSCLTKKAGRDRKRTIVIVDDLALPFGSIRIRKSGSSGGHNGLESIIERLGTNEFIRLRIGISPDHTIGNTTKFVLERFPAKDSEKLEEIVKRSARAVCAVIESGVDNAMAQFND